MSIQLINYRQVAAIGLHLLLITRTELTVYKPGNEFELFVNKIMPEHIVNKYYLYYTE